MQTITQRVYMFTFFNVLRVYDVAMQRLFPEETFPEERSSHWVCFNAWDQQSKCSRQREPSALSYFTSLLGICDHTDSMRDFFGAHFALLYIQATHSEPPTSWRRAGGCKGGTIVLGGHLRGATLPTRGIFLWDNKIFTPKLSQKATSIQPGNRIISPVCL